jgi:hypothetical protein
LNFQILLKLKIILEQSFHIDSVRHPQMSDTDRFSTEKCSFFLHLINFDWLFRA